MDNFAVDTPMNTGRIDTSGSNKLIPNSELEFYEYLYPIIQNDTELGWFLIGVNISEDRKEFENFLTGIVSFEIGLFFILVFISYVFTKRITSPIISLHDSVKRFASGEKNVEVNITAKNELFDLGQSFNQMTKRIAEINEELEFKVNERTQELEESIEKLKKAQEQAQEAAMQAGMAEIATNVLHNVGNVLNSVNVSAGAIKDILFASNVNNLPKISNLFLQHKEDIAEYLSNDARGKLIPDYLAELSKEILNEKDSLRVELDRLIIKINSIKEIIVLQQDYASRTEVKERINLKELINDSIVITGLNTIKTKINLNLVLEDLPNQILNKHKVVQILVNLLKNSKEALLEYHTKQEHNITVELKKNSEKNLSDQSIR
jgi:HAMP domain-containing protein